MRRTEQNSTENGVEKRKWGLKIVFFVIFSIGFFVVGKYLFEHGENLLTIIVIILWLFSITHLHYVYEAEERNVSEPEEISNSKTSSHNKGGTA